MPPLGHAVGNCDVAVSAKGLDGQTAQTTFVVTVTPPIFPLEAEIAVNLGGGIKLEMVLIPAGGFLMGSPDSDNTAIPNEKPQHRVRITKPFYLGKYLSRRNSGGLSWAITRVGSRILRIQWSR